MGLPSADAADPAHEAARELDAWLQRSRVARVTSDYVLDEALTGIRSRGGLPAARRFLDGIEAVVQSRSLSIERIDEARFRKASRLFRRLDGKLPRLSFTDCTSFTLMRDAGIGWAFTADAHFDSVGRDLRAAFQLEPDGRVTVRPMLFD